MTNFCRPLLSWSHTAPLKEEDPSPASDYIEDPEVSGEDNAAISLSETRDHTRRNGEFNQTTDSPDGRSSAANSEVRSSEHGENTDYREGIELQDFSVKRTRHYPADRPVRLKIVVLGDTLVGKTPLVNRILNGGMQEGFPATVGVDFALKTIQWSSHVTIDLQISDVAGYQRVWTKMLSLCLPGSDGCLLVCDVTRRSTLDGIPKWKAALDSRCSSPEGSPIPCLLLGNKIDSADRREVSGESLHALCSRCGIMGWREVSVKDGTGIQEAFQFLLQQMLDDRGIVTDTVDTAESGDSRPL